MAKTHGMTTETPLGVATFDYDAFLSYSHAADGRLAPELQAALQSVAKPWYRRRALRVFRDRTSLSATPELWPSIERALARSRFFIVLASPEAAASPWIDREVGWWRVHRSPSEVLIVLTDGRLEWDDAAQDFNDESALPPTMRSWFGHEPLWVDLRWASTSEHLSLRDARFRDVAAELAAPLRALPKDELVGEDIREHRRTVRLARGAAVLLLLLTLASIGGGAVALVQRDRAVEQRDVARSRELATASLLERPADPELALILAVAATEASPTEEAERALRLALSASLVRLTLHHPRVTHATYSGDGRRIATAGRDGAARLWDAGDGRLLREIRGGWSALSHLSFTPGDAYLLVTGYSDRLGDGLVRLWDVERSRFVRGWRLTGDAGLRPTAAASADGRRILTAQLSPDDAGLPDVDLATLWRADDRAVEAVLFAPGLDANEAAFSPDGRAIAVTFRHPDDYRRLRVSILATSSGRLLRRLTRDFSLGESTAWSPDGRSLATIGLDPYARIWRWRTGSRAVRQRLQDRSRISPSSIAWSPGGTRLATSYDDGGIRIWDARTGQELTRLVGHLGRVASVDFAPTGDRLVSASDDGTVRVWAVDRGPQPASTDGYEPRFSHDAGLVVMAGPESASVADVLRRRLVSKLPVSDAAFTIAFSPDARYVIGTPGGGSALRVWDAETGRLSFEVRRTIAPSNLERIAGIGHIAVPRRNGTIEVRRLDTGQTVESLASRAEFDAVAMSPDGRFVGVLATDRDDPLRSVVRIWDWRSSRPPVASATVELASSLAFTPDGRRLLIVGSTGETEVRDVQGATDRLRLVGHTAEPHVVAFSPDGARLATASAVDGTLRLWDLHTGALVTAAAEDNVTTIDFSPDGRFVATTASESFARIRNATTGEILEDLHGRPPVRAATFRPDSRSVALGSLDDVYPRIRRCELCASGVALLRLARARITRQPTALERARYALDD
jgi:WD40 repeat protein